MQKKHVSIPVFIPEMACPFKCIYCDQQLISGTKKIPAKEDVISVIEKYLTSISINDSEIEVGFFGGSFTGIPLSQQKEYLQQVQPYIEKGIINSIRLSTRPDYITEENLLFLKDYHVKTIELGAQSLDNEVLKKTKRGHTVEDVEKASALIKSHGFDLGLQMMIGLPGDNQEKTIATAIKIINLKADNTRIYPTLVIKNTLLEKMFIEGDYHPLKMDDCIATLKILIPIFEEAAVNIIRVGLHPSKDLQESAFIAGPFHPSLREIAETEIWADKLKEIKPLINKRSGIIIFVSQKQYNFAIGYKAKNRKMLLTSFESVKFEIDNKLKDKTFYVNYN